MRKVFSNSEVAHIWAQQQQQDGRNSNGSFYFRGRSIYSYGAHFEIARFVDADIVLLTVRGYSVTTAKHISYVRVAVTHKTIFNVPSFTDHKENIEYYNELRGKLFQQLKRARSARSIKGIADNLCITIHEQCKYAQHFRADVPQDDYATSKIERDVIRARYAEARELALKEDTKRQEKEAKEAEKQKENLEKWLAGAPSIYSFHALPVYLRIKDAELETSRGAFVPLNEAKSAYRMLKKDPQALINSQIGSYTVTKVLPDAVIIGCHNIPMAEIERVLGK